MTDTQKFVEYRIPLSNGPVPMVLSRVEVRDGVACIVKTTFNSNGVVIAEKVLPGPWTA